MHMHRFVYGTAHLCAVMGRDDVTCMESVGLGFCLKLSILWGELPHILSRVTKQKEHRLKQTYSSCGTILCSEFK